MNTVKKPREGAGGGGETGLLAAENNWEQMLLGGEARVLRWVDRNLGILGRRENGRVLHAARLGWG